MKSFKQIKNHQFLSLHPLNNLLSIIVFSYDFIFCYLSTNMQNIINKWSSRIIVISPLSETTVFCQTTLLRSMINEKGCHGFYAWQRRRERELTNGETERECVCVCVRERQSVWREGDSVGTKINRLAQMQSYKQDHWCW